MNKSLTSIVGILLSFTLLTGCNEKANTNAATKPVSGKGAQSESSASPEVSTSSKQPSMKQTAPTSSSTTSKKISKEANPISTNGLAKKIIESARKYETLPHLPKDIGLGTSNELIREVLGEASTGGKMLVFEGLHTQLTLDANDKVTEITSNHRNYKSLNINDVKKEIGKPDEVQDSLKNRPDIGYIKYNIKQPYLTDYLLFYYDTQTKKVIYIQLYFESQADKVMTS